MRFAGSAVDFTAPTTGVTTGGYSGAAGVVDIADSFGAQREKAPKYDEISSMAMQTSSAEKRAAMQAEADVMSAGIQSIGQAKASQMTAECAGEWSHKTLRCNILTTCANFSTLQVANLNAT